MKRRWLWWVLAASAAVRLAALAVPWTNPPAAFVRDADSFTVPAHALATTGRFETAGQPEILRTPGYPVLLLAGEAVGPEGWRLVLVIQVLLDVLLVYVTYRLAPRLCGDPAAGRQAGDADSGGRGARHRVAIWAALLQALSVAAIVLCTQIMSDTLFALLFTVGLLLLVRHLREGGWRWLVVSGVIMAAAAYVRPVVFIFLPAALLVLLWRRGGWKRALAYLAVFGMLVLPWTARNWLVAGYPKFSATAGANLFLSEAPGVRAAVKGISTAEARVELEAELAERVAELGRSPTMAELVRMQEEIGGRVLRAHPLTWIKVHLRTSLNCLLPAGNGLLEGMGLTAGSRGTLSVLQTEGLAAAVRHYFGGAWWAALLVVPELVLLAIRYAGCLAAAVLYVRPRMDASRWLVLLTVLVFLLSAGPVASARFRLPIEPLLSIASAGGIVGLIDRYVRRRGKAASAQPQNPAGDSKVGAG